MRDELIRAIINAAESSKYTADEGPWVEGFAEDFADEILRVLGK